MKKAKDVAVIIGAGSGIGKALAIECANRGYRIAAADIDPNALKQLEKHLPEGSCYAELDVSNADAVSQFANSVVDDFGDVELLINSAGVFAANSVLEQEAAHWMWVMEVNFGGTLNAVKAFAPQMLGRETRSYIVNIASISGLSAAPMVGAYSSSKAAVIAMSETLHLELQLADADLQISVACPGPVKTEILNPDRYEKHTQRSSKAQRFLDSMRRVIGENAMKPDDHARFVLDEMFAGKFWILPHKNLLRAFKDRAQSILGERNPSLNNK